MSTMSTEQQAISNTDDVIDTRDIETRISYLRSSWAETTGSNPDDYQLSEDDWKAGLSDDEAEELVKLLALADEYADQIPDWRYGETLIHEDYFVQYAQELAEDIGAYPLSRDMQWPLTYIDWDRAADALRMDYWSIDFDGETYWVRS